jgi:hypothetical protein
MAGLAAYYSPPTVTMSFSAMPNGFTITAQSGNGYQIKNGWKIDVYSNYIGVDNATCDLDIALQGDVLYFTRDNSGGNPPSNPAYGIGIPARFTVDVVETLYTGGVFVSDTTISTTQFTISATGITSSSATIPSDYTSGANAFSYRAKLKRVEIPWILP